MGDLFSEQNQFELPFKLPVDEGYSAIWDDNHNGFIITIPNGELFYSEEFFNTHISDRSIEYFLDNESYDWKNTHWRSIEEESFSKIVFKNIDWNHDKIKMYGKEIYLPRYSAWYGDCDKPYTYSGLTLQPKKWNRGLLYIRDAISDVAGVKFNSVLMNWYRDGEDHIGWHSDSETELGINPVIGSVNFGETRDFVLRSKKKSAKIVIPLKHGTLLIMKGELQHYWEHSLPKRKSQTKNRVNLTFRVIKNIF